MNLGVKPMPVSASSASWKSGDGVSDRFPAGLRVLVVDDDPTCLRILEKMLRNCLYEVTKCSRAEVALKLLRDNKDGFDVVISDVHMPDMDGFKLLEHIGLEMDLPVIMMSADDGKNVVMKGVTHGACDYLIKPVRMEALKNIWQHVVRKKKHEWREKDCEQSGSVEDGEKQQKAGEDVDYSSSANEGNWKCSKKRKEEEDDGDERDDTSTLKKPRVVWSVELHQQFVTAVNQLGIDKAVPKKILELMNVPSITRENVASHLQKYRLYLKRLSIGQHQNGLGNSFMGPTDPSFGPMASLKGLELQAFSASGSQLPPQSLANIQAASLGRPTINRSTISGSLFDQRNVFSFESPRIRFVDGQQLQQHKNNNNNINNRQVNLLHGIPTNMDSRQIAAFGNVNLPIQPQSSQSNPLMTQMVPSGVLGRNGVDNIHGQTYAPISQPSSLVDFSRSQRTDFSGNNDNNHTFSGMSNSGLASTSRGPITQGEANYDAFNAVNQNRTDDWGLQNVGPAFGASQLSNMQGRLDVAPSVLFQTGHIRMPSVQPTSSMAASSVADNSSVITPERLPEMGYQNILFPDQFGQEDLMSALLKQPEGVLAAPGESDFDFDGYHLDNLPV